MLLGYIYLLPPGEECIFFAFFALAWLVCYGRYFFHKHEIDEERYDENT